MVPAYSTDGPGPSSWGGIIGGAATFAIAIIGSMLWMRWRGRAATPGTRARRDGAVLGFGVCLVVALGTGFTLRSLREPYAFWVMVALAISCCSGVVVMVAQATTPLRGRIVFGVGYVASMVGFVVAGFMRRAGHVEMAARTANIVAYVVTGFWAMAFVRARSARR